ncbi:MAG: 2-oxo acid dehydrogenase subunit E2, partial [Acidimicrobiales bacterium]
MTNTSDPTNELGPNAWLVDEMRSQWAADPDSVDSRWRALFAGEATRPANAPTDASERPAPADAPIDTSSTMVTKPTDAPAERPPSPPATAAPGGEPIRGVGARIVTNMEASLGVPTATSFREVPAKLLEVNRKIINGHLGRKMGGKVSFTHLIGYAVVRAIADSVPAMNNTFTTDADGKPLLVRSPHIGLGIAVDLEKRDGT